MMQPDMRIKEKPTKIQIKPSGFFFSQQSKAQDTKAFLWMARYQSLLSSSISLKQHQIFFTKKRPNFNNSILSLMKKPIG